MALGVLVSGNRAHIEAATLLLSESMRGMGDTMPEFSNADALLAAISLLASTVGDVAADGVDLDVLHQTVLATTGELLAQVIERALDARETAQ